MRCSSLVVYLVSVVGLFSVLEACSGASSNSTSLAGGRRITEAPDAAAGSDMVGSGGAGAAQAGGRAGGSAAASGGTHAGGSSGGRAGGSGGNPAAGSGGAQAGGSGGQSNVVARPSYNTGTGFFVANGKLYDANGVEFRIRGVDKCHFDVLSPGIPKTHANTIRMAFPLFLSASVNSGLAQDMIDNKIVPWAGVWYTSDSWAEEDNVTCNADVALFNIAVDQWVAHASTFKPFERYMLINIANEWGPADSAVWRDAHIQAVARLRAAGYLATLVIDAGGCGQDPLDITKYAQAIFDSDPQKNIVFDQHIYGLWSNGNGESWQTDLNTGLDALAKTGLPIVLGEFGPGRDIGPSPTKMTPKEIIQAAEARGFGWTAWAWDDGDSDDSFALSYNGDYNSSADLTLFGKVVVEDPTYGLLHLAQPATSFTH